MVSAQDKMPAELKPGAVFRIDYDEIDEFEGRAKKFRIGDEDQSTFQLYRLSRGTYGQRQEDNQMMRIKLPYGGVTADQMDAMAEVSEIYSGLHRGHITTRENFQFHFVNLDDAAKVMRILGAAGLTTREACAHTVRNITACPDAGVSPDETFDTTPWLVAYARNMLRNPICQRLPRKFKTSFSNSGADNAGSNFHDLGFIARERTGANGQKEYGFELRVGGGTSTMPRLADTVWEFATLEDGEYIRVSEAILRIFDREGDLPGLLRKNLNKARIKFLLHKIGAPAFIEKIKEELAKDWAKEPYDMATLTQMAPEEPSPVSPTTASPRRRLRALAAHQRRHAEAGRLRHGDDHDPDGQHLPRSSSASWRASCASTAAATPAPTRTRTWCCAGCVRESLRMLHASSPASASASPTPTWLPTSSPAPAPTAASSRSRLRTRPATACARR